MDITNQENQEQATKCCNMCRKVLPLTSFYKKAGAKDGLQSHCKECHRQYSKSHNIKTMPDKGNLPLKGAENSPLRNFTPRELIEELKARGYYGELHFNYVIKV